MAAANCSNIETQYHPDDILAVWCRAGWHWVMLNETFWKYRLIYDSMKDNNVLNRLRVPVSKSAAVIEETRRMNRDIMSDFLNELDFTGLDPNSREIVMAGLNRSEILRRARIMSESRIALCRCSVSRLMDEETANRNKRAMAVPRDGKRIA